MTSSKCLTGTDRVAELLKINSKIYINVQGDEPTIDFRISKKLFKKIKYPSHVICGYDKINKFENPLSKNIPKVVLNKQQELIYISRNLIPDLKKIKILTLKQVCIYAFNKNELNKFMPKIKSIIENIEDIEILRFFDLE